MVQSALREDNHIIEENQKIVLTAEDTKSFLSALKNPSMPNKKLKETAKIYFDTITTESLE